MTSKIDYVKATETFIRRLKDGMFIITPKATELRYVFDPSPSDYSYDRRRKTMSLGDCLTNAIRYFETAGRDKALKQHYAELSYSYIERAWLTGSLQESQGLTKKLEECKAENTQLRKKMEELSVKYLQATDKIAMFEKHFPPLKKEKDRGFSK